MMALSMENLGPLMVQTTASVVQSLFRIGLIVIAGYVGAGFLRAAVDRLEAVLVRAAERTEAVPGA
ncbi:MAG TPA: hypothetical protein VFF51_04375, partial [Candidatus Methylomirabilis sp.]|nr:hypothetical protein [Candidatus Methylomirabilis sp.]